MNSFVDRNANKRNFLKSMFLSGGGGGIGGRRDSGSSCNSGVSSSSSSSSSRSRGSSRKHEIKENPQSSSSFFSSSPKASYVTNIIDLTADSPANIVTSFKRKLNGSTPESKKQKLLSSFFSK
jgi:hypothetical protein